MRSALSPIPTALPNTPADGGNAEPEAGEEGGGGSDRSQELVEQVV